jgi:hypothetical protein
MSLFHVTDLPLEKFMPGENSWPEDVLRLTDKPAIYVTEFRRMGCYGLLLAAPINSIICVAPSSAYWKHGGYEPEPIQGGPLQLAWLDAIQNSKEKAKQLKADLRAAGFARERFRRGVLPYEGGACCGAPEVGVSSKLSGLSKLFFRSYLIPHSTIALQRFVDEFERLYEELGYYFIRPLGEQILHSGNAIPIDPNDDYEAAQSNFDLDAVLYRHSGGGHPTLTKPREIHAAVEKILQDAVSNAESGKQFDFLDTNPYLVDEAILLPVPSPTTFHSQDAQSCFQDRLCSLRARLIRLLGWAVFYLGAHRGLAAATKRYNKIPPREPLPYDIEQELKAYLINIKKNYPVISVSFMESVWE